MKIELGILGDGGVMLVCEKPLDDMVKRVEYYREQRLFMLVFEDSDEELMEYEIPSDFHDTVDGSPNVLIYTLFENHDPVGYKAPLIKVGDFY